jgi:hypothetical protein
MLKSSALRRSVRAWLYLFKQPVFWEWVFGIFLLIVFVGMLMIFAVNRHDAFLRLRPLVCEAGLGNRQFFIVAMAGPIAFLLMLATVGELWEQLDRRRHGVQARWFHFLLFLGLASGLGILVLFALGC